MGLLMRAWRRVRALVTRDAIEGEIDREIRLHVDLLAEEHERAGMSPADARRAALRRFGNPRALVERGMDVRGAGVLDDVAADLRHTARALVRNRTFTMTAGLTLALAIGAHTIMFSVVQSVLLRWPYPDADRLVRTMMMTVPMPGGGRPRAEQVPEYLDWKQSSAAFDAIEAYTVTRMPFSGLDQPLSMTRVTSGLPALLGMRPAFGRLLQDDDFRPDAEPVLVLAYAAWMGRFGGDRDVIGRAVRVGDTAYAIVGVAEPIGGPLLSQAEAIGSWPEGPSLGGVVPPSMLARLRAGATLAQAQTEVDAIGWPSGPIAVSLIDSIVGRVRPNLVALFGATALILLIAVSNVANLLAARVSARRNELAVRAALGAGRGRLVRLLLTESMLLALLGGAAGFLLATVAMRLLLWMEPTWIPRSTEIAIEPVALAMTAAVTVACGLLTGAASMVTLRGATMRESTTGQWHTGRHGTWLRSGLLVTQLALSLVLLAGSALMIRSYVALRSVPIGFDYRNIVSFSLPGGGGFRMVPETPETRAQLQRSRDVLERVRTIPGVRGVTLTNQPPLSGDVGAVSIELLSGVRRGGTPSVELIGVTEDFFEFFDSQALSGRLFDRGDVLRADRVAVVDATLAALLWPGESPVGQRIRMYDVESEIIGVSEPIRYGSLTEDLRPKLYHLLGRSGGGISGDTFLVRHDGRPGHILTAIEARMREIDPALEPAGARTLAELYDGYLREPRFYLLLLGALGALALIVATVGIYGVVAYSVSRRIREVGIRIVLGARWPQILLLFGGRTMRLVVVGLGAGLVGAVWLTQYIETLLFGIEPTDAVAFAATAALLGVAALMATLVPMRRALRVDPATTLRAE